MLIDVESRQGNKLISVMLLFLLFSNRMWARRISASKSETAGVKDQILGPECLTVAELHTSPLYVFNLHMYLFTWSPCLAGASHHHCPHSLSPLNGEYFQATACFLSRLLSAQPAGRLVGDQSGCAVGGCRLPPPPLGEQSQRRPEDLHVKAGRVKLWACLFSPTGGSLCQPPSSSS